MFLINLRILGTPKTVKNVPISNQKKKRIFDMRPSRQSKNTCKNFSHV